MQYYPNPPPPSAPPNAPGCAGTPMSATAAGQYPPGATNQQHYTMAPSAQPNYMPMNQQLMPHPISAGPIVPHNLQAAPAAHHPPTAPAAHDPTSSAHHPTPPSSAHQHAQHYGHPYHYAAASVATTATPSHASAAHASLENTNHSHNHAHLQSRSQSNNASANRAPVPYLDEIDPDRAQLATKGDPDTSARLTQNAQQIASINSANNQKAKNPKKRGRGSMQPASGQPSENKRSRTEAPRKGSLVVGQRVHFVIQSDRGFPLREDQLKPVQPQARARDGYILECALLGDSDKFRQQVMSQVKAARIAEKRPVFQWNQFAFAKYSAVNKSSGRPAHWKHQGYVTSPDSWTLESLAKTAHSAQHPRLRRIHLVMWRFDDDACPLPTVQCEPISQVTQNQQAITEREDDSSQGGDDYEDDDADEYSSGPFESPFAHVTPLESSARHSSTHPAANHHGPDSQPPQHPAVDAASHPGLAQQQYLPPYHVHGQTQHDALPQPSPLFAQQQQTHYLPVAHPPQQHPGVLSTQHQHHQTVPQPPTPHRAPAPLPGVDLHAPQHVVPSAGHQQQFAVQPAVGTASHLQPQVPPGHLPAKSPQPFHAQYAPPAVNDVGGHQQYAQYAQHAQLAPSAMHASQQPVQQAPPFNNTGDIVVHQQHQQHAPPAGSVMGDVGGHQQHAQYAQPPPLATGASQLSVQHAPPAVNDVGGHQQYAQYAQHAQLAPSSTGASLQPVQPAPPIFNNTGDTGAHQQHRPQHEHAQPPPPPPPSATGVMGINQQHAPPAVNDMGDIGDMGGHQQHAQHAQSATGVMDVDQQPVQHAPPVVNDTGEMDGHQQNTQQTPPPPSVTGVNQQQVQQAPPTGNATGGNLQQVMAPAPMRGPVATDSPDPDIVLVRDTPPSFSGRVARPSPHSFDPTDPTDELNDNSLLPRKTARRLAAHQGLELQFESVLDSASWTGHGPLLDRVRHAKFNAEELTRHYEMATSAQVRSFLQHHVHFGRDPVPVNMPKYPTKETTTSAQYGTPAQFFDYLVWAAVRDTIAKIEDFFSVGDRLHGVRGNTVYPLPVVADHVWSHFRRLLLPSGLPSTATVQSALTNRSSGGCKPVFADFALFGMMAANCAIGNAPLPTLHPILIQFVAGSFGVVEVVEAAIDLDFGVDIWPHEVASVFSRLNRARATMYPTVRDMGHALEVADFALFGDQAAQVKDVFVSGLDELTAAGLAGTSVRNSVARRYVAFMLHHYLAPLDAFRRGLRLGLQRGYAPTSFRNNLVVALLPNNPYLVTASPIIRQLTTGEPLDDLDPLACRLMLGELRGWLAIAEEFVRGELAMFASFVFGSHSIPPATDGSPRVSVQAASLKKKKNKTDPFVLFSVNPPKVTFYISPVAADWNELSGKVFADLVSRSLYEQLEKLRSRSKEDGERVSKLSSFADELQRNDTLWKDWIPGDSIEYAW